MVYLDAGAPEHVPSVFQRKRVNDQRLRVDELKLCVVDKGEQSRNIPWLFSPRRIKTQLARSQISTDFDYYPFRNLAQPTSYFFVPPSFPPSPQAIR